MYQEGDPVGFFSRKDKEQNGPETTKEDAVRIIKETFDSMGVPYEFDPEKSAFAAGFKGDDLDIMVMVLVRDDILSFVCPLDLKAGPDNYQNVVWALNGINMGLVFGMFYLEPENGFIVFEYGFPYSQSRLPKDFFMSLLNKVLETVDARDGDLKKIAEKASRPDYDMMYR